MDVKILELLETFTVTVTTTCPALTLTVATDPSLSVLHTDFVPSCTNKSQIYCLKSDTNTHRVRVVRPATPYGPEQAAAACIRHDNPHSY